MKKTGLQKTPEGYFTLFCVVLGAKPDSYSSIAFPDHRSGAFAGFGADFAGASPSKSARN